MKPLFISAILTIIYHYSGRKNQWCIRFNTCTAVPAHMNPQLNNSVHKELFTTFRQSINLVIWAFDASSFDVLPSLMIPSIRVILSSWLYGPYQMNPVS